MDEAKHRFWDITIRAVTTLALFCGAVWALYKHFDTEAQKINATFWNKRLELYLRTGDVAGGIAAASSPEDAKQDITDFWQLYYGQMSIIEEPAVKEEMENFAGLVRAFQGPEFSPTGAETKPVSTEYDDLPPDELHRKKKDGAKKLADVMHASLRESWAQPFDRRLTTP